MKKLIYTIICFKCILQITEGSQYQKYIKLFSHLLILCMCCGMLFSMVDDVKSQWEKFTYIVFDEESIKIGSDYYEEKLMEALEYETDTGEAESGD